MGNAARQLTEPLPAVIPDLFEIGGFTFEFASWICQAGRRAQVVESMADPKSYEPYVEDDEYNRFCDPDTGFLTPRKVA